MTGEVYSVEPVPTLLVNDEKFKDPTDMANAFKNFFIIVTKKLITNCKEIKNNISFRQITGIQEKLDTRETGYNM